MKIIIAKKLVGTVGIITAIAAILLLYKGYTSATKPEVINTVYPLFSSGISWSPKVPVTLPPRSNYNPATSTLRGFEVVSLPTTSTQNIGATVEPLRNYYDQLLLQQGWHIDVKYQADGPGGSVWGFTKGSEVLIFSYTSTFLTQKPNTPEQCPCTVVFIIIGGQLS